MKILLYSVIFAGCIYWSWDASRTADVLGAVAFILAWNVLEARENIKMLNERISEQDEEIIKLKNAEDLRQIEKEVAEHNYFSTE